MQIIFLSGTKCLWLPQYVNKFLGWFKKFGPAQKILGPVKEQGISFTYSDWLWLYCGLPVSSFQHFLISA
jgi:hypothetical protein